KRDAEPYIGGDRSPHGCVGAGENGDWRRLKPDGAEPMRQRTDQGVEEPAPGEAGQEDRHRPREEDEALYELSAVEWAVEKKGQSEPQEELKSQASNRPP